MAKKMTLSDYEKRVSKEEEVLLNLEGQLEELENGYQQKRSQLREKINQQQRKVREAESDRFACLLDESGLDFNQVKSMLLSRQDGGGGHV